MSRQLLASISILAGLAVAGCVENDLPPGSFIDRERVLGARVEVEGDPLRASPMPGEQAIVRWIVAGPTEPTPLRWSLAACAGTALGCTSDPFVSESGTDLEPRLSLAAPAADALGDRGVVWIAGEIEASKVMLSVPLALDGAELANRNPSLAAASLAIGDTPWTPREPDDGAGANDGCVAIAGTSSLPVIRAADDEVELALTVAASDRETYSMVNADGTTQVQREMLQISHFTTIGTLDRQFTVIEHDAADGSPIRVNWIAPEPETAQRIPGSGVLARFLFVVRDGRGGLDVTARVACLVP